MAKSEEKTDAIRLGLEDAAQGLRVLSRVLRNLWPSPETEENFYQIGRIADGIDARFKDTK
jgi:hypothetical protein